MLWHATTYKVKLNGLAYRIYLSELRHNYCYLTKIIKRRKFPKPFTSHAYDFLKRKSSQPISQQTTMFALHEGDLFCCRKLIVDLKPRRRYGVISIIDCQFIFRHIPSIRRCRLRSNEPRNRSRHIREHASLITRHSFDAGYSSWENVDCEQDYY